MTDENKPLWVLGYGSLLFKPPPHAKYMIPGIIQGYIRRFWQSSSDHRGTPNQKGRVVTLISYDQIKSNNEFIKDIKKFDKDLNDDFKENDLKLWACAYFIPAEFSNQVLKYLNIREQDGYTIHNIPFQLHINPEIHNQKELKHIINKLPIDLKSGNHILTSTVYIGTINNKSFIGPEDLKNTAKIISKTSGSSGTNWQYLEKLYYSVLDLDKNGKDLYLEALMKEVEIIKGK